MGFSSACLVAEKSWGKGKKSSIDLGLQRKQTTTQLSPNAKMLSVIISLKYFFKKHSPNGIEWQVDRLTFDLRKFE